MAFFGLIFSLLAAVGIILLTVLLLGVCPIIVGTVICCRTVHKVLGLMFRIIGFVFLIPAIIIGIVLATALLII